MNIVIIISANLLISVFILFYRDISLAAKIFLILPLSVIHTDIFGDFGVLHIWVMVCLGLLLFRKFPVTLVLILFSYALITYLQFLLFDDMIFSLDYYDWSRKLPVAFGFLIIYLYICWHFVSANPKIVYCINYICIYVILTTTVLAISLNGGIINENFDLWQNNGNDTSLIVSVAWLHFMFHHTRSRFVFSNLAFISFLTACTLAVTIMAASRWSTIFVVAFFVWWFFNAGHGVRMKKTSIAFLLSFAGTIAVVGAVLSWSVIVPILTGSFLQLTLDPNQMGVNVDLLWEGINGKAPLVSSVSYRINGAFAAIGSIFQTGGLGVGTGRAVAVNEMVSGYAGSLHVVAAELFLELGVAFPLIAWLIIRSKLRLAGVPLISAATVSVALSMMSQSSGYLTHYFTWYVVVSLVFHYRSLIEIAERDIPQKNVMTPPRLSSI